MIIMTVGIPGIGKSTFLSKQFPGEKHYYLSADLTRLEVSGDESDQTRNVEVWDLVHKRFEEALRFRKNCLLDACFVTAVHRRPIFDRIREAEHKQLLRIIEFPIDVDLAMERQKQRTRKVSKDVVEKFARKYEAIHPSELEGISYELVRI